MNKRIITFLTLSILIFSCGSKPTSEVEKKKKELIKKKQEMVELQKQISELEAYVTKNDTSDKSSKKKLVNLMELKAQPFEHYIEIQGTVDSDENVFVSPAAPGLITSINVKEGDRVGKGTVMASTESSALQSSLVEVQSALDLATIAYEKQKRLWDQKIGSEIQYLQAKTQMESLQARKKSVQGQLAMGKVIAPFSGTVDEVSLKLGEMASPGYNGIRIVNLDNMKATAKVSDTYISKIKKGAPVSVYIPDVDRTFDAKISFVSQVISTQSRSFAIDIKLNNKERLLRPNLIAKINVNDETIKDALVIPSKIIQKNIDGSPYILIAEKQKDGSMRAKKVDIETGSDSAGNTVVTAGLKEGDIIITDGFQDLIDGQIIVNK
jgi:membrane fusion protein (multidrug efflux system)